MEGPDHLTVIYSEALSREVLSFINSTELPPFFEVIAQRVIAAIMWVAGLILLVRSLPGKSVSATRGLTLRPSLVLAQYGLAGLLHPIVSSGLSLIPGVGTSSFFSGIFLSISISIALTSKLGLTKLESLKEPLSAKPVLLGFVLGLSYPGGLQLIVGNDMMRMFPSSYGVPAVVISIPILAASSMLEASVLNAAPPALRRWPFGVLTKALALGFAITAIALISPQLAGFFLIFAYSALLLIAPLYLIESEFASRPELGQSASMPMFVTAISLLIAAAGARM